MRSRLVVVVLALVAGVAMADDLRQAEQLGWEKKFAESEALYRRILADRPQSGEAKLGLARVVLWQGRYAEAIALFAAIEGVEALEGRATAEYWSGDLRRAARDFRHVLELDPNREFSRRALAEIHSLAVPSQQISIDGVSDDQPLDGLRAEAMATFFSDPLTRWSVAAGGYHLDAGRIGARDGEYLRIDNQTTLGKTILGASVGVFTFPDGTRRPIGGISIRHRSLTLRVDHREEIASAASLRTHAASTSTALRWDHDRSWIGAAEVSHRRYFDGNESRALVAYAVFPLRRRGWTLWSGGSAAARDSDESRFRMTAVSATREGTFFRYSYRGEYDPYWTPDNLLEARAVIALERRFERGGVKVHADGGYARDRGRAFGPDAGPTPFPSATFTFTFDRTDHPWRAGLDADWTLAPSLAPGWRIEAGVERSVTVDYRSTTFHAALVRRR